jgi:hypothetical protein
MEGVDIMAVGMTPVFWEAMDDFKNETLCL